MPQVTVWIPDVDVRVVTKYVNQLREHLRRFEGPDEVGVNELCDELDVDSDMFSAVWAFLASWERTVITDIRRRHD